MRKEQFVEGEYYHIYNRGVDKRPIFDNDRDRLRFVHSLYVLNNFVNVPPRFNLLSLEPKEFLTPVEPYVDIVAASLMPNHYHLLLTPRKKKGGVSTFLHKIGASHTLYYNKLNKRSGRLFESTFKAKHVDRHEYASYLTQYIHLNHVRLQSSKISAGATWDAAETYRWSSLPVYLGRKCPLSSVVNEEFRTNVLGMGAGEYRKMCLDLYQDRKTVS